MKRKTSAVFGILIILFVFALFSCDDFLTGESDYGSNGNDTSTDNCVKDENDPSNGGEIAPEDQRHLLRGTWSTSGGNIILQFNHSNLLFRNWQTSMVDHRWTRVLVTQGNFRWVSYDGETVELLDFNNDIVSFSAIIYDDMLIVSGLHGIRWTAPPIQPRFFGQWNGTYRRSD